VERTGKVATAMVERLNVSAFKKEAKKYAEFQYEFSYKSKIKVETFMEGVVYTIEKLRRAKLGRE
jgi:hypothetical protein